jgi:SAM-dependent methyltransferase
VKLEDLQQAWNEAGKTDPLWAVLAAPDKKGNRWQIEEFLQTGIAEIEGLMQHLEQLGRPLHRRRALDFGCGPGRLSQALGQHFERVDGIDISPSMIELARRYNQLGDRCQYHVNDADSLGIFPDGTFDLVYSSLTLQHLKPDLMKRYLKEFFRVVSPSGVVVFQLPARPEGVRGWAKRLVPAPLEDAYRRARYGRHPAVVMHGLSPAQVRAVCQASGVTLLDVTEQQGDGKWASFLYSCATVSGAPSPDTRAHTPPRTPAG